MIPEWLRVFNEIDDEVRREHAQQAEKRNNGHSKKEVSQNVE